MRLAVTSDLHLGITSAARIMHLVDEVREYAPDAVVVAGDVAESTDDFSNCLEIFKRSGAPVSVLAGNHDLWARGARSRDLWESILPDLTRQHGCRWFEADSFAFEGVAVTGTIAWYDYSAVDSTVAASPEMLAREKHRYNLDAEAIDWPWSDIEFARQVAGPFLATLDRLEADPTVHQIVVITHVPVLEPQMLRKPQDLCWAFSNAYFGNLTLGAAIADRPKVTHVISGHTHVQRRGVFQTNDGRSIETQVLGSEYQRPTWLQLSLPPASPLLAQVSPND